jgi:hypothetical protein
MNQELIISKFLEKSRTHDKTQQRPTQSSVCYSARGNGATVHNASYLAARHKAAADSRGETLVPGAGKVSSAVTLTSALRI